LSPENYNPLHNNNLQENQGTLLPKNCQNTAINFPEYNAFAHELQVVISAWPGLDDDTRRQIVELARKGGGK